MSYTVEKMDNSQVKLNFDVDAKTFENAIEQAYQKSKGKFAIAGFRKGHVPKKVIEGVYGKEVFFEDAMDIVIPNAYGDALQKEEDLEVVAQPEVTAFDFKEDGGATFTLLVTVKPEVELGKYKGLNIDKKVKKVTAKDVDAELNKSLEKQARLVDSDAAAQNGSIVNIDFAGSVDGVAFEGGSAEKYDLELGSGSFIPGFEEQLVGVKTGDKKEVTVKFPADYHAEELKDKEAVFACTVNAVKTKELPVLDDEFAKEISEFDTLKEYKEDLKAKLQKDAETQAERDFENAIVEKIVDSAKVEIPAAMVDEEADAMVQEFEYRLMYQGIKLDDYLGYLKMTKDQLKGEYKVQAEKSVKTRLVMEAIVKAEEIKFEDADVEAKIEKMATESGRKVEDFKKSIKKEQIDYAVNQILSEKLMNILKAENAKTAKEDKAVEADANEEAKPQKKASAKKVADDAEAKPAPKKKATKKDAE